MEFIDDEARAHFSYLQQSIGQNFASVLNNPRESESSSSWSEWGTSFFKPVEQPPPVLCTFPTVTVESFVTYCSKVEKLLAKFNANFKNHHIDKEDVKLERIVAIPGIPAEFFSNDYKFFQSESFGVLADASFCAEDCPISEEELSEWLATVESLLFKQVKGRSAQFFQALAAFHSLKNKVAETCDAIRDLRKYLAELDQEAPVASLKIVELQQQKSNNLQLLSLIETIQSVVQVQDNVQVLLQASEYNSALDLIDATIQLLQDELSSVVALKHLQKQLQEMKANTAQVMQDKFVAFLMSDNVTDDIIMPENVTDEMTAAVAQSDAAIALTPVVQGLIRSGSIQSALQTYKSHVVDKVKKVVNDAITRSMDVLSSQPGFPTAAQLQALEADGNPKKKKASNTIKQITLLELGHFVFLLNQVFDALFPILKSTSMCTGLLTALIIKHTTEGSSESQKPKEAGSPLSDPGTPTLSQISNSFSSQLLLETVNDARNNTNGIIHSRIMRLFEVRANKHESMSVTDFVQLTLTAFEFVHRCEAISNTGHSITNFHSTLITQCKAFFFRQHEKNSQKLTATLAQEQWKHEKAPGDRIQTFVDQLSDYSQESVQKALAQRVDHHTETPLNPIPITSDIQPYDGFLQPQDANKDALLWVGNRGFPIGVSVLVLVSELIEYDKILFHFPFIAVDILQRILDLVKTYEAHTTRLVLGAGAIETAGLKTITTHHLALAIQSLSFVSTFVPFLKARYLQLLPPKHAAFVNNLFEKFFKDIVGHQQEFYQKIVNIMKERLNASPELALDTNKWMEDGSIHIRNLIAEIGKLWKALKQYFHLDQIQKIFSQTVTHYNAHLRAAFKTMDLQSNAELKEKVVQDIKNYRVNIQRFGIQVLPGEVEDTTEERVLESLLGEV